MTRLNRTPRLLPASRPAADRAASHPRRIAARQRIRARQVVSGYPRLAHLQCSICRPLDGRLSDSTVGDPGGADRFTPLPLHSLLPGVGHFPTGTLGHFPAGVSSDDLQ